MDYQIIIHNLLINSRTKTFSLHVIGSNTKANITDYDDEEVFMCFIH